MAAIASPTGQMRPAHLRQCIALSTGHRVSLHSRAFASPRPKKRRSSSEKGKRNHSHQCPVPAKISYTLLVLMSTEQLPTTSKNGTEAFQRVAASAQLAHALFQELKQGLFIPAKQSRAQLLSALVDNDKRHRGNKKWPTNGKV